jgi:hypothetical protein
MGRSCSAHLRTYSVSFVLLTIFRFFIAEGTSKEKKMSTFETLHTLFMRDLQELQQLQKRGWLALSTTRVIKEEHLGRCCYLAEELLDAADLLALKHDTGLNEKQWRGYKTRLARQ